VEGDPEEVRAPPPARRGLAAAAGTDAIGWLLGVTLSSSVEPGVHRNG
jgi:hypothetical protein